MTYTDCDDLDVEACDGCGREYCVCDDSTEDERCDACLLYAEWQCPVHGPAYLAMQQAEAERAEVVGALRTILAHPDAHPSTAWAGLVTRAREVLGEMHENE